MHTDKRKTLFPPLLLTLGRQGVGLLGRRVPAASGSDGVSRVSWGLRIELRCVRDAYTLIDWLPPFPSSGAAFTLSLIRLYLNRFRLFSSPSTRDKTQFHLNQRSRPGNRSRFFSEAFPD